MIALLKLPFYIVALSLLGGAHSAWAQDAKVSLKFITFPQVKKPETIHLAGPEGKITRIEVGSRSFSQPVSVITQEKWSIVEEPAITADPKKQLKILGQVRALSAAKQLIILIRKGNKPTDGYSMVAIPDPSAGGTGGSVMLFNLSTTKISGRVGGKKLLLGLRKHKLVKPKLMADGRNFQSLFAHHLGGKPKMFYASTWPVSKGAVMFVFFYNHPTNKRLMLHSVAA